MYYHWIIILKLQKGKILPVSHYNFIFKGKLRGAVLGGPILYLLPPLSESQLFKITFLIADGLLCS